MPATASEASVTTTYPSGHKLRLLVAIASFGDKNLNWLKSIIRTYQTMDMSVDVVVVSNAPKELGPRVKVIVGLPTNNPWSLPFAHKPIFAQDVDAYDLFIYSEDDMAVTENNIRAFLRLTPYLKSDEIAGFIRYELKQDGEWTLPEAHGVHHWRPESVRHRGIYTIAEFTNEHAGFYILTQGQLKQAVTSGGFLRGPCRGRYGWPETAATDPYTNCGFRKVICISSLNDFLIHHLPNRYVGQLGVRLQVFREQIEALKNIGCGHHPASTLCGVESKLRLGRWSKRYDELPLAEVLRMVPAGAKTVLSVGVGTGALEVKLMQSGMRLTALPLDSVVGDAASRLGMEVIYGSLDECFDQLVARRFDCVVMTNLLHLQSDPGRLLRRCCELVEESGVLVLSGPNFSSAKIRIKRLLGWEDYRKLGNFQESGVDSRARSKVLQEIHRLGFKVVASCWFGRTTSGKLCKAHRLAGRLMAESWVIQLCRK